MAICIVDAGGVTVLQTPIPADKQMLVNNLAPYRPDVAAVERLFA